MPVPTPAWRDTPVPAELRGLWRRLSIEYPDGGGDLGTEVLWLQAGRLFADIRVPPARKAVRPAGFADLDPTTAAALAAQEAFAGTLRWTPDACSWVRLIDFQPPGASPDEGTWQRTRRVLVEGGLHAAYVEHWWQDIAGPLPADAAGRDAGDGRITVRVGDRVMTAIDRRPAPPPADFAAAVARAAEAGDVAGLTALLDCEISYGVVADDGRWRVALSTLPWCEGEVRVLPEALRD